MKRVHHLFVPSLSGCLLVASFLSSCTSIHGPFSMVPFPEEPFEASNTLSTPIAVQRGIASWYGKPFHGRRTASGERYNMYHITAAHRTMPLGTYARVTNLSNGKAVQVRINDRGPYAHRRILDLSYSAARQLDMVQRGSGRVQVEFFAKNLPAAPVSAPSVPAPSVAMLEDRPHTIPILPVASVQPFTVQAGAYHTPANAVRAQQTLMDVYPQVSVSLAPEAAQALHRVRLGPFDNRAEAERIVQAVRARGYDAMVVAMAH